MKSTAALVREALLSLPDLLSVPIFELIDQIYNAILPLNVVIEPLNQTCRTIHAHTEQASEQANESWKRILASVNLYKYT